MSRRPQYQHKHQNPRKEQNSGVVIVAIIGGIVAIITTIIALFGNIFSAKVPIDATRTAEALHTSVAMATQANAAELTFTSTALVVTSAPVSTPTLLDGYIYFDSLINGRVDAQRSENLTLERNKETICVMNVNDALGSGYFLAIGPQNPLADFDGVNMKVKINTIEGNWASVGFITIWGDTQTGVKIGVYYIGPGPAPNDVDGEISVVTTSLGANSTEASEVFQIHPDLFRPFTLRVEKSGAMVNLYYNDSDAPFVTRPLLSADMYGAYAQLESNISDNTNLSACWNDISVLYR